MSQQEVTVHTHDTPLAASSSPSSSPAEPASSPPSDTKQATAPSQSAEVKLGIESKEPAPPGSEGKSAVVPSSASNSRGIPAATFLENVPETCGKNAGGPEAVLKELHHLYGKYKFMENSLVTQKRNLVNKIPEIKNALAALKFLMLKSTERKTIDTHFEVADAVYAKAQIRPENKVLLWLGANVMLEYGYDEAQELLTKNLANAQTNLATLDKDLAFLKDQITISEVNIARVHNHKVQLKQEAARAVSKGK